MTLRVFKVIYQPHQICNDWTPCSRINLLCVSGAPKWPKRRTASRFSFKWLEKGFFFTFFQVFSADVAVQTLKKKTFSTLLITTRWLCSLLVALSVNVSRISRLNYLFYLFFVLGFNFKLSQTHQKLKKKQGDKLLAFFWSCIVWQRQKK